MRRSVLVPVVVVCVLGAVSCSRLGQPSTTPPSATPAMTGVAAPAASVSEPFGPPGFPVPAEARVESEAGAVAATRYYFQLQDATLQTLDTTWLDRLSRDCDSCDQSMAAFAAVRESGNRYEGGGGDVTAFFNDYDLAGRSSVGLLIEQEPVQVVGPDGTVVPDGGVAADRLTGGAFLSWSRAESVWIVNSYDLFPAS